MSSVTFLSWGPMVASSRYRAIIPQWQLAKMGIPSGKDWVVLGKHGWTEEHTRGFKRVCFDVCDDHFSDEHAGYYRKAIASADLVTCNSNEMRRVILVKTGRDAVVIPDPYEQRECPARVHDKLLWFGHRSNLRDITEWAAVLPSLEIVTNVDAQWATKWTPENMEVAFQRAGLVVIPTGKSMAKSANRAIESLRRGLFVVAGYLPAYADLGIYIGNIGDGVEWALSHQDEVIERTQHAQRYIANEYSPERIGLLWKEALGV